MGLKAFTAEVNGIAKDNCEKLNARQRAGKALFGAVHHVYPEDMMAYYHERGITPQQAFDEIQAGQ